MAVRDVYYSSLLYIAMCHLLLSLMCWYFFVVLFAEEKKKELLLPPKTARHRVGVQELRVFWTSVTDVNEILTCVIV